MSPPSTVALLSLGGALGVNARYWLGVWVERKVGAQFPWGTFAINVSGSFAIGLIATLIAAAEGRHPWRLLLVTGFLGGYTTFSSYVFEALGLWERGAAGRSAVYAFGSLAAGLAAVVLGVALGRAIEPWVGIKPVPAIEATFAQDEYEADAT